MSIETLCDQTADVYSCTNTAEADGSQTAVWTKTGSIKVKIWEISTSEVETAGVDRTVQIKYKAACALGGVTILDTDRLYIGSVKYDIYGVRTIANHHRQMMLVEHRPVLI